MPGSVKHFDHYSLNCVAALKNKFSFPNARNRNSPLADIDYAYQFDASAFARYLRDSGLLDYWHKHGFPPQCRPHGSGADCH